MSIYASLLLRRLIVRRRAAQARLGKLSVNLRPTQMGLAGAADSLVSILLP